jgi:hypothetical protein
VFDAEAGPLLRWLLAVCRIEVEHDKTSGLAGDADVGGRSLAPPGFDR